jgi:D-inositol-3-phosphate glycosyltransferase
MTVYVRELARSLAARGISTDVFTRANSDAWLVTEISPGVRVVSVEAGPREPVDKEDLPGYLDDFIAGIKAFAISQRAVYDVVHSHYWQSGLAGLRIASAWAAPLVHSHHTLALVKNDFLAPGDTPEPQSRVEGEERVISGADVLIASTDGEWEQLSCLYGAAHDRLKTIHPGVDHALFSPGDRRAARSSLGLEDEAVMLYVGRIQPLKGLDLAVLAFEELAAALERDALLIVVGGPSGAGGRAEFERLRGLISERGLEERVRFAGPQPHDILPLFYRAADVLAVCSHSESFGLSALEAQACGTPVIGTAVGGLSYVVADGSSGFLLDSRDPSVFAGRAKMLLTDESLHASFAHAAVARASMFSWDRMAESFHELYDCLVNERAPEFCTC